MSAEQALFDAYREWRRITVAAGQAIQRRNWEFLRECQEFIQKLQPQISRLTLEARREWRQSRAEAAAKEEKDLRGRFGIDGTGSTQPNMAEGGERSRANRTRTARTGWPEPEACATILRNYTPGGVDFLFLKFQPPELT